MPRAEEPLKVLIVHPWGAVGGGAETMLLTLLERVDRSKLDVRLVLAGQGDLAPVLRDMGFPVTSVAPLRLRSLRSLLALARAVRRRSWKVDVVLSWMPKAHLVCGPLLATGRRTPTVVWWQHGLGGGWMDRLATAIPCDAVGCSSETAAVVQRGQKPTRDVFVVYPGVVDRTPLLASDRSLRPDRQIIGFVGRFDPNKHQLEFLRCLEILAERGLPVHGLLIGEQAFGLQDAYARLVRQRIAELKADGLVTAPGLVDARTYYPLMDVYVNAASNDSFGITTVEAMAAEVPIVAVGRGGSTEILEHRATAVLVDSPDADALALGVREVLEDPAGAEQMAKRARTMFEQRYAADQSAKEFADRLYEVTGRDDPG